MIDRFIFTAMTGAKHAMGQLANNAHNMANVQTPGFREVLSTFRGVAVNGASADSRSFVVDSVPGWNHSPGPVTMTDNPLDVALQGLGFFAVLRSDGTEAYSRSGRFTIDPDGFLRNMNGLQLVGEGGPIQMPEGAHSVRIRHDGGVYAVVGSDSEPSKIDHLKLVNPVPQDVWRADDGLFEGMQPLEHDDSVRLITRSLEQSNVNLPQAMVDMIKQNRLFELNLRLVQAAEQNARNAGGLLSLSRV